MGRLRISSITDLGFWIKLSSFPSNYWWLRSPSTGTGGTNWAFFVDLPGDFGGSYVGGNSYGRYSIISPGTVTNLDAFTSTTTGDVNHAGNTSIYTYSYGNGSISSHARISSLCRIAGLKEFVFQLFYFHKGA